jgi:hypothetical protein
MDQEILNRYACFPRHTLSLSYNQFSNSALGNGVSVAYSLAPYFVISNQLSLFPFLSIGLMASSYPYDAVTNPGNKLYSLPVNGYLNAGGGVRWQFSNQLAFQATATFHHVSNGGWHDPNVGLNWATLGGGVEYSVGGLSLKKLTRELDQNRKMNVLRMDLEVFGLIRSGLIQNELVTQPVAGLEILLSQQTRRIHAWTLSLEFYQDQFLQNQQANKKLPSQGLRLGAMTGHEFFFNKFIFSQQLGIYLAGRNDSELLYHRWGLQYQFLTRWRVGINLRAYRAVAEFTDVRLSYTIFKKTN